MGTDRDRHRRLGHDVAGLPYPTATTPTTPDGGSLHSTEPIASRSTDEEARDLLALQRAKRGDTGAFAELVRANDDTVRTVLWALTGAGDLDAHCAQVYLRAYRGLPLAPSTSPRIWLLGITDGTARDLLRREGRHDAAGERVDPPIPLDAPADERLVVAAVEGAGLTPREAARLVTGRVEDARRMLTEGRARPGLSLPLPDAPAHGPRFWDDLGRRLLIERSAPAASRPRPVVDPSTTPVDPPTPAASRRTSAVARGMAVRVSQQHPRVFPWRKVGFGVAVVASVVVFIGLALSLAGNASRRDAGLGDTASKTLDRLDAALARNTVVRGTATITSVDADVVAPGSYRFVRSNTGSWRVTASDESVDEGYDVPRAAATTLVRAGAGQPTTATVRTGLAPGPPEATGVAEASPGDILAEAIRTVRRGTAGSVRTSEVDEKAVWVVTSRLDTAASPATMAGSGTLRAVDADEVELVADQSLALPTRLTLQRDGRTVLTIRFSSLSISQQPATTSYAPAVPTGVVATTEAHEFVPLEAGQLAGDGRQTPLTPAYLPGGYVLAAAGSTQNGGITVVCYRNGSRQLVLTRRPSPAGQPITSDPFTGSHGDAKPASTHIDSGSLAGQTAYSSSTPITHVWVNGPVTQVVAAGDPTVEQLTKVLASLR